MRLERGCTVRLRLRPDEPRDERDRQQDRDSEHRPERLVAVGRLEAGAEEVYHPARHERADDEPHALRRRREPRDRAPLVRRHQLEEQPPRQGHHGSAGDRDEEDEAEVPGVPLPAETARDEARPVHGRRDDDHPREPDAVADAPRHERGDDVAAGDGREDVGGRRERLAEPDGHVQDDERAGAREGPFPRRVRHEERGHVAVRAQHPPRVRHVRPHALEDASVTAVLRDEEDRDEARDGDDRGRGEERRRAPERGTGTRRRSAHRRSRCRERRAARPARARRPAPGGRPGTGRGRAARRRSRRRTGRRASAPSSRGSA